MEDASVWVWAAVVGREPHAMVDGAVKGVEAWLLLSQHCLSRGMNGIAMATKPQTIPPAEALSLHSLVTPTEEGIASRVLARTAGGNLTLFAFDAGQDLTEHTSPFDALVMVLEGSLTLTIGGKEVPAVPGTIVRMPANMPHAVSAPQPARMLLLMLREPATGPDR
jgi:quercetin dioxygenase-like cupin family protein